VDASENIAIEAFGRSCNKLHRELESGALAIWRVLRQGGSDGDPDES